MLSKVLSLATVLVLVGTLPLAIIAAHGFRNSPFGGVLKPIPVVLIAYIALNVPNAIGMELSAEFAVIVSGIGVVSALVAAVHAIRLLTERKPI